MVSKAEMITAPAPAPPERATEAEAGGGRTGGGKGITQGNRPECKEGKRKGRRVKRRQQGPRQKEEMHTPAKVD